MSQNSQECNGMQYNLILQKRHTHFEVSLSWQTSCCNILLHFWLGANTWNALPDSQTHSPGIHSSKERGETKAFGYQQIHALCFDICWQQLYWKTWAKIIKMPSHNNCCTTIDEGSTSEKTKQQHIFFFMADMELQDYKIKTPQSYWLSIQRKTVLFRDCHFKVSKTSSEEIRIDT